MDLDSKEGQPEVIDSTVTDDRRKGMSDAAFSPEGIVEKFHALSKREAEVCALVALRWKTQEIASHLFLSPRTVEKHLESVFLKLDVRSRDQLRSRLGAAPLGAAPPEAPRL